MEDTLRVARQYEGKHEVKDKDELQTLLGIDPSVTAWCAHFVKAVLEQCGYDVSGVGGRAVDYKTWGEECEPEPGCVVVFPSHVAFLDDDTTKILGGNQSNKVGSDPISWYGKPIAHRRAAQARLEPAPTAERVTPELRQTQEDPPELREAVQDTKNEMSEVARAIEDFEQGVHEGFDKVSSQLERLDKRIGRIEEYLEQFSRFNEEV